MLEHSDCTNFVKYRRCVVNNKKGCYSLNFLNDNEQLITFEKFVLYEYRIITYIKDHEIK